MALRTLSLLALALVTGAGWAAGERVDAYWAEVLARSQAAPDIVQLQAGTGQFLGLYRKDLSGVRHGGVILLPAMGAHPDWPQVIAPLRRALPQYGWDSLAIQLPALEAHAGIESYPPLFEEAAGRIAAAIAYLREQGVETVVLVGHGLGATLGAAFLAQRTEHDIAGFVAIGIVEAGAAAPALNAADSFARMTLPILDVYGERDQDAAAGAPDRADAARRASQAASLRQDLSPFRNSASAQEGVSKRMGLIAYRRFEIPGADRGFADYEPVLIKRVIGWLNNHAGGITTPRGE